MYYIKDLQKLTSPPPLEGPFKEKDEKWHRDYCHYIYSHLYAGSSGPTTSSADLRDNMLRMRQYGNGDVPIDQYKNLLLGEPDENGERADFKNINWDSIDIWGKFKRVVINMMLNADHKLSADAIDERSGAEKESKKWQAWFDAKHMQDKNMVRRALGLPEEAQETPIDSLDELELMSKIGGFKLLSEIAIEQIGDLTDFLSDKQAVKESCLSDFVDFNVMAARDYICPETKKVKYKYIDPLELIIIGGGGYDDLQYKKATAFGYYINMTMHDIRMAIPNMTTKDITNLAKRFSGAFGNPIFESFTESEENDPRYRLSFDDFIIPVLDCEMLTIDIPTKTEKVKLPKTAKVKDSEVARGKVRPDAEGEYYKEIETGIARIKNWRRAKWIIGTDIVFDYGLIQAMARPTKANARPSFTVYQSRGKSLGQQAEPIVDSINLTWYRYQGQKVDGDWGGVAIEWSALGGMKMGKKALTEFDILKIYDQTQKLVWRATTHMTSPGSSMGIPIIPIQGSAAANTAALIGAIERDLLLLREITGINEVVASSDPNPEVGLGQSKIALGSANNALGSVYRAWLALYGNIMLNISSRAQVIIREGGGYEGYYPALGDKIQTLKIAKSDLAEEYGIKIVPRPTQVEIDKFDMDIRQAMAGGKNGNAQITMSDALLIRRILYSGASLKDAELYMAMVEEKRAMQQREMAAAAEAQRSDNLMRENAAKDQGSIYLEGYKSQLRMQEESHKANEERKTLEFEASLAERDRQMESATE